MAFGTQQADLNNNNDGEDTINGNGTQQDANNNNEEMLPQNQPTTTNTTIEVIQQQQMAAAAMVQSNRMTRNGNGSLKRSSISRAGTAFSTRNPPMTFGAATNPPQDQEQQPFSTFISSPPPLMFSPNSTSIRLATGNANGVEQQNIDYGGLFCRLF
jgi:hypothetical protein